MKNIYLSIKKNPKKFFKNLGLKLLNNKFFPLNPMKHTGYHKTAVLVLIGLLLVLISLTPYEGEVSDLLDSKLIPENISEKEFDERNLQTWINLASYKRYNEQLTTRLKLPKPQYPLLRKVFENINGESIDIGELKINKDQIFPPINIIEINKVLRKTIGSGITIKTEDEILYEIDLSDLSEEEMIEKLNELKKEYWTISSVVLKGEKDTQEYKVPIGYQVIPKTIDDLRVPQEIRVAYNERRYIPNKIDTARFEHEIISKTFDLDERTLIRSLYKPDETGEYYNIIENMTEIELEKKKTLRKILNRIDFELILDFNNVFDRNDFPKYEIKKAVIYKNEEKVLRHKPNSRLYVDDSEIPDFIKKAFVLVEDDFFFVNVGGIDPPGLMKATINYILIGAEKGNASITEQIYEMYLGKQKKKIEDKFVQILFAIYYSYYTQDRNEILNFYIQSIPGSFWGDHCYGIKSIAQNYLGRSDISSLTWKELAWMTRIALLPSVHGIEYARFALMKEAFEEKGYDIFNEEDIDNFLLLGSNIQTLRFPGDKVRNADDMKRLIEKYRRSYEITTKRINQALKDFREGNNFMNPLITEEEYNEALEEDIKFVKPDFTNLYQVYTDQTRKDINRIFGKWAWNAGFTVTVALDEAVQNLIERELEYSTIVAPYFKYWPADDAPQLGGGSVMVETHDIDNPFKIKNKISAISSIHPEDTYFNWAVDGYRHFGSIYKWLVLLLYLDQKDRGTLLDQYYDIPREFVVYDKSEEENEDKTDMEIEPNKNNLMIDEDEEAETETDTEAEAEDEESEEEKRKNERNLYDLSDAVNMLNDAILEEERERMIYRPDNWKKNPREDIFGYYTYRKETNITNFIQSKNVTFVHLSWVTGIELLADFLNKVSGIDPEKDELRRVYQPFLSTVLGTGESSSIAFAQATSIISNKGKWKPLSTIEKIVEFDDTEINFEVEPIQIVSREAAEQAFYVGYINTFIGTARRFIKGGIGKTGTADTDVSFLAMTGRDKDQKIEDKPNHILNSNLLYLANVGVNSGKLPDGLWGGLNGAYNARDVFRTILGWNGYEGKKEDYEYEISGDFTKTYSDEFEFKEMQLNHWTGNYTFNIPVPTDKEVYIEESLSSKQLEDIKYAYERLAEVKYMSEQWESIAEGVFTEVNPKFIDINTVDYAKEQMEYNNYVSPFEKYRYSWMQDPNIEFDSITGNFTDKRTGKVVGNSLDLLNDNQNSIFGSSGNIDNSQNTKQEEKKENNTETKKEPENNDEESEDKETATTSENNTQTNIQQ